MFDLGKCILVTSSDRTVEKWGGKVDRVVPTETYEEVLLKARDLTHINHRLPTHPQAPSLKPNRTPYRTILLYSETEKGDARDIRLIEEATETFNKQAVTKKVPKYDEKIVYGYKTINLSIIESVIPRLWG